MQTHVKCQSSGILEKGAFLKSNQLEVRIIVKPEIK